MPIIDDFLGVSLPIKVLVVVLIIVVLYFVSVSLALFGAAYAFKSENMTPASMYNDASNKILSFLKL